VIVTSLWFCLLTGLTLGFKALATRPQLPDEQRLATTIAAQLNAAGFTTRIEVRGLGHVVHARRGDCQLMARSGDQSGQTMPVLMLSAKPYGALRFGYRGSLSDQPARLRPTLEGYAQRQLAMIGIAYERPVQIAFALSPACNAPLPDLSRLGLWMRDA
jgi:hypothetical protein